MNEFENILKVFGQIIMAVFSLVIASILFSTLAPMMDNSLNFILGLGFVLIFVGILVAIINEIKKHF